MNKTIDLHDGRRLGYAEYGVPEGKALLYFHGSPGCRLERCPDQLLLEKLGIRFITVDRPGYGLSDPKPDRTLCDWVEDVSELVDALELERFALLGFSGGGPHAMACAAKLPHRLTRLALASSVAPLTVPHATEGMGEGNQALLELARQDPAGLAAQFRSLVEETPDLFGLMQGMASAPDQEIFSRADFEGMFREDLSEAVRPGVEGLTTDFLLFVRPWGFTPETISVETSLWHGGVDVNMPIGMGQYLASAIPNCQANFIADEGHYLLFDHWPEILSTLID